MQTGQQQTPVQICGTFTVVPDSPAAPLGATSSPCSSRTLRRSLNPEPEWPGDYVTQINILLAPGADVTAVRQRLQQIAGGGGGPHGRGEQRVDPRRDRRAGTRLRIGGAGALVVGLFLVYNALSVSVAERRHDIGILRLVGAHARPDRRLFVGEAAVLGLAGSLLGVPLGYGLARGAAGPIRQLLSDLVRPRADAHWWCRRP